MHQKITYIINISVLNFIIIVQNQIMEEDPETLQKMLNKYYDSESKISSKEFWNDALAIKKLPAHCIISSLQNNQQFIYSVISFLIKLPFQQSSKNIIHILTQYLDPSPAFIKNIIQQVVPSLQTQTPCLSTLNICLSALNSIFHHQNLLNSNLDSHILMCGNENGISVQNTVKWPFDKGGTLTFWYKMDSQTKQCKIFEIVNQEKVGFEILVKNKKIYIQKRQEQTKFRLMKNKSAFLCQALFDEDVKLCIEFEIKKKFFQPYFSINVHMNNFVMNGVEMDSINFNSHEFNIFMLRNFYGKFYSSMILTQKLASQVEELHNIKGFIYENEVRNFMYIFDMHIKEIFLLFTAIRSETKYTKDDPLPQLIKQENSSDLEEGDNIIEKHENEEARIKQRYPSQTFLFDAINKNRGKIDEKSVLYENNFIKKEMGNYGGFSCYVLFLQLLEISSAKDQLYTSALNTYLQIIKTLFMHKTDSIEQANQINFFNILSKFFERTKMQGFSYDTISKLKQIFVSLNTRVMRQKFIRQIVWGVNFGLYLSNSIFSTYVKFVKSFYNEDIQTTVDIFGVPKIMNFVIDGLDNLDCCYEHMRMPSTFSTRIKNYSKLLKEILQIIENICLIKRVDDDLPIIFIEICSAFSKTISPCFIEALISFIQIIFIKDSILYKTFIEIYENHKLNIYTALASCSSWKTKGKIISFLLTLQGKKIFEENNKEKQMLTLCSRYPTINVLRPSSIKSQENKDSIEYSEDKLSLNSINMNKFVVISPIKTDNIELFDELSVIQIISDWAFSEEMMKFVEEQVDNPGFFILMELYKGSTYILRRQISKIFLTRIQTIRFSPELMAWSIQCLLISIVDSEDTDQTLKNLIEETQRNLLRMICTYDVQTSQQNELSIIKLVYSSVKSKYQDDINNKVGNKIFLMISLELFIHFEEKLKSQIESSDIQFDQSCKRVLSNCFTFIKEYFILKGDEDEAEFQEQFVDLIEQEGKITLTILEQVLNLLIMVTSPHERKIIEETNGSRNLFILSIIFPQKQKQQLSFLCLILVALQTIFECFQDLNMEWRKRNLILIKRYLIYLIQVSENCENARLQYLDEELKNIFLNAIGFLQNKFYQYFYYPFHRHKNVGFQIQNKIRKNIDELKRTIFNIFVDVIELLKYIDEKGSMEHKSFYELMKPKRKSVHKYSLKNFYPPCWKKADQKIIQFMHLNKETLKKEAQQKLESHIIQKRITIFSSTIQKAVTKRIGVFIEEERKMAEAKQRKSVNFYKMVESQKCTIFSECEEQITLFRLKSNQEEKINEQKRRQYLDKQKREINHYLNKIWTRNRTFEGFWTNENFYSFSQNQVSHYDNSLKQFYRRTRSRRQSTYGLTPFIKIQAIKGEKKENNKAIMDSSYANKIFIQGKIQKKVEKTRKSQKLKGGLQFIKKKMIDKLMKTSSNTDNQIVDKNSDRMFLDVLWVKPMMLNTGHLKVTEKTLIFCYNINEEFQHLSLLKNNLTSGQILLREWKLEQIQCFQLRKFLLKQNSVEIFFKNRKSIFFSFYGKSEQQFPLFLQELNKMKKKQIFIQQIPLPLRVKDPFKEWDKLELTQKWLNYEISNFDYLMSLNIASGRSNCDLNQYPIFPWVLSQYSETKFRKSDRKFRDFSKNMGTIGNEERTKKFIEIYKSITENHQQQFHFPHHFGFHYSNIAIVIQYLIRLSPYTFGAQHLQGGKFDIPDRIFSSIPDTFKNTTGQMSDVRELIPEFFYFPEFLINIDENDFGQLQIGKKKVNHVQLPDGCLNAFDFVENHRQYIQSKEVSQNIHKWIDLVFGYKSCGKEAQISTNTFHYLTYESSVQYLNSIEDPQLKESLESQMMYYGKTPSQLFTKPHPQRSLKVEKKKNWVKKQYEFYKEEDDIILFSYLQTHKGFIILRKNGEGKIFEMQNLYVNIIENFKICLNKFEELQMFDERNKEREIPIVVIKGYKIILGGLWGGKILIHNLENKESECFAKHSDTVTALAYSQKLNILVSASQNGEIASWDCNMKVAVKQKVFMNSCVNSIIINEDLNIVVSSGEDGILGVISLEKMEVIRTIKLKSPIINSLLLTFPYYMFYIECKNNQQYCYSLNGQQLEMSQLEKLFKNPYVVKEDTHHEKVVSLIDQEIIWIKLPDFTIEDRLKVGEKVEKIIVMKNVILIAKSRELFVFSNKQKEQSSSTANKWLEMFQ